MLYFSWLSYSAHYYFWANPFQGMFPRHRKRKGTEADEDNMASRLQLALINVIGTYFCLER